MFFVNVHCTGFHCVLDNVTICMLLLMLLTFKDSVCVDNRSQNNRQSEKKLSLNCVFLPYICI